MNTKCSKCSKKRELGQVSSTVKAPSANPQLIFFILLFCDFILCIIFFTLNHSINTVEMQKYCYEKKSKFEPAVRSYDCVLFTNKSSVSVDYCVSAIDCSVPWGLVSLHGLWHLQLFKFQPIENVQVGALRDKVKSAVWTKLQCTHARAHKHTHLNNCHQIMSGRLNQPLQQFHWKHMQIFPLLYNNGERRLCAPRHKFHFSNDVRHFWHK